MKMMIPGIVKKPKDKKRVGSSLFLRKMRGTKAKDDHVAVALSSLSPRTLSTTTRIDKTTTTRTVQRKRSKPSLFQVSDGSV